MEKINAAIKVHTQITTFLIIWGAVVWLSKGHSVLDLWLAVKYVPLAISIYVIAGIFFSRWMWRWPLWRGWLVKIPDLQGTWKGQLVSDWVNPETGKRIEPITMFLVIRQTLFSVKVTLMTKESTSYSTTADINIVSAGEDLYLNYNYTNRPKVTIRDRSAMHDGAAILKIITSPQKCLEGEYWTSRKTRGEIKVEYLTKDLVEQFLEQK
jgi:hypothetical protein